MNEADRWDDYTMRVIAGDGGILHLASNTGRYTACGLGRYAFDVRSALADMPICSTCRRAIEAGKRRTS